MKRGRRRKKEANREDEIPLAYEPDEDDEEFPKYGFPRKHDPDFKGPIRNRSSTDIICCFLFVTCLAGLGYVGFIAFTMGDPTTFLLPIDYQGKACGVDESVKDKPFLFYFDLTACATVPSFLEVSCDTPKICVEACPNETYSAISETLSTTPNPDFSKFYCRYGFDPKEAVETEKYTLSQIFDEELCAPLYFDSKPAFNRCIPAFLVDSFNSADDVWNETVIYIEGVNITDLFEYEDIDVDELQKLMELLSEVIRGVKTVTTDVLHSYKIILLGWAIGMTLSLLYIILMRWFAGFMVWTSIILLFSSLISATSYCFYFWFYLGGIPGSEKPVELKLDVTALANNLHRRQLWMILGCTIGSILLIIFLIFLCLCNKIKIAVALIKESSRAVTHMLSTLVWPLIPFVLLIAVTSLWMGISVFLASAHEVKYAVIASSDDKDNLNGSICNPESFAEMYPNSTSECQFISYALRDYVLNMQVFNLFMLFWLVNFVVSLGHVTLAGAYASYYFARNKSQDIPSGPLTMSFWRAIRYHLGSVAFGSLIIAMVQMIRTVLEYIEKKLKKNADNPIAKYIIKCFKCLFCILEKILKFINKNAFIMMSIYGENFCKSGRNAFFLLMRNIIRVTVVTKITHFVIFLGELTVASLLGVFFFFYFNNNITFLSNILPVPLVSYYWGPIAVICIGTLVLAKCFFSVFDMAVDTLFMCFLEDLERNDGTADRPYYMSSALKRIVMKKKYTKTKTTDDL